MGNWLNVNFNGDLNEVGENEVVELERAGRRKREEKEKMAKDYKELGENMEGERRGEENLKKGKMRRGKRKNQSKKKT